MKKDFKIGLAIGVALSAVVIIWLATLPNLSTKARALEVASSAKPSPKIPADISPPVSFPSSADSTPTSSIEYRESSIENPDINNQPRVTPAPSKVEGSNETQTRIHVVQKGDTLSSISSKYYGSAKQWRKIVNANRTNLPDPNRLVPGIKLIIPD
jgi:5'-nucleotidase / UDP-sugar diphosphatase